jgi:ammonium transporter Rh
MAWTSSAHIPLLFLIQIIFIILFGVFSRYDPKHAMRNNFDTDGGSNVKKSSESMVKTYAMFQDVHVMIFIGFGFLMTFLKKYGLSAVSLNMLVSALSIQWSMLVHGFIHPHCQDPREEWGDCPDSKPWIDINIVTLLSADFATAAVLISFGVVLGTTNPAQLAIMAFIEIVLFNVNEYIGRNILMAVDAGDTIFVHMFGAYFGLAASRVLYNKKASDNEKAGANHMSDLFSMVGTIFLWMFWPSFNAGAAASGDAQMRAVINTYLSLCACVLTSFATSAMFSPTR